MVLGYTKKQLVEMSIEEKKTAQEYKKRGFIAFAKDEARHSRFFKYLSNKK